MESVAACPGEALAVIREALAVAGDARDLTGEVLGMIGKLWEAPDAALLMAGAVQNLADALLAMTPGLDTALAVTRDVIAPAYEAGFRDGRDSEALRRRQRLQAV